MVKKTRTSDLVDASDMEALLNRLRNAGVTESSAFSAIGYKSPLGTLAEVRRTGLCKRVIVMALKGLVADKKLSDVPKDEQFGLNFEEAELVYDALRKAREVWPSRKSEFQSLQGRVAIHMASRAKEAA